MHNLMLNRAILGFLIFIAPACANNIDLTSSFEIPDAAFDVKKLVLGHKNNQQIFFRVKEEYPSSGNPPIFSCC